jgi:hypothetical protein
VVQAQRKLAEVTTALTAAKEKLALDTEYHAVRSRGIPSGGWH